MDVDPTGMKVDVKLGDSRSNRSRDIRLIHFVRTPTTATTTTPADGPGVLPKIELVGLSTVKLMIFVSKIVYFSHFTGQQGHVLRQTSANQQRAS